MIWLLVISVLAQTDLSLEGFAGQVVSAELRTSVPADIEATYPLTVESYDGETALLRIDSTSKPGTYESMLYLVEKSGSAVRGAVGVHVDTQIEEADVHSAAADTFTWWPVVAAGILALLFLSGAVRIRLG